MADDYTLIFLGELAAGLFMFCGISGYAYVRIRKFRKDVGQLGERLKAVEKNLHECRNSLNDSHKDLQNRLSISDMDHSISLFSMHVLHHMPHADQQRVAVRKAARHSAVSTKTVRPMARKRTPR